MSKSVIILGGGVAGLSAAHELLHRGFIVKVFEHKPVPGGKARSVLFKGSGTDGRADLPGEHGFRFFPRFYKHLPQTMKEIPLGNGKTVFDNLVDATRIYVARYDAPGIVMSSRFPRSLADLEVILKDMFDTNYGLKPGEAKIFARKIWQLMTSCPERRLTEYEKIGWWDFIEATGKSEAYQTLLASGLTRTLVAAQPKLASTRTGGDIMLQLMFDIATPGGSSDRVLNGPTNDVWINPWLKYLHERFKNNFEYHLDHELEDIFCDTVNKKITKVTVKKLTRDTNHIITAKSNAIEVTGDYFIAALPVEIMADKVTGDMLKVDPTLENIKTLKPSVSWMNGIQFYLNKNVKIDHGHTIYVNTQWALTSISQIQFWQNFDIAKHGNGKVKGILSVDVSDWYAKGLIQQKEARNCSRQEIKDEIWAQLKKSLNYQEEILKDEYLETWFLDPDILTPDEDRPHENVNLEPLLVNRAGTWALRPTAHTLISNFMLASDYVQTYTDLATMEGANEAARRAVNSIIQDSGVEQPYCQIWNLHEPDILAIWRWADKEKFDKGLPWDGKISFFRNLRIRIKLLFKKIVG
ncbi:MAG TPA: FAD-dependent oxidoreductase [Flavobacteriales bacterium]|nr:FAD-dependent oxidoreductase [Flavobacteriales bacterium]